jgi:hypothetical protein
MLMMMLMGVVVVVVVMTTRNTEALQADSHGRWCRCARNPSSRPAHT